MQRENLGARELGYPIKAWINETDGELYVSLANNIKLLSTIRPLGSRWITMRAHKDLWILWHAHTEQMRRLGLTAVKNGGDWQFKFADPHDVTPIPNRMTEQDKRVASNRSDKFM